MAENNKLYEYFGKTDLVYLIQLMYSEFNKYQKAVSGKGLSTEDFTTAFKDKLDGIDLSKYAPLASPALTGTPTAPTAASSTNSTQIATTEFVKAVLASYAPLADPALTGTPTAPTAGAGTNSTQIATTAFVGTAVANALASITGISFSKVDSFSALPTTGKTGVIYLVPKTTSETNNIYTEYYWDSTTSAYEKLGDTTVDLSNYVTKDDIGELSKDEVKSAWDSVFTSAS
jgi:hypothetical protein